MYLVHEKVSLKVALNDDDNDVDDEDVQILYCIIWNQLFKNLKEFILINFMFISSLYICQMESLLCGLAF